MLRHAPSVDVFLARHRDALGRAPAALIFVEDEVELASTAQHCVRCGFDPVIFFMRPGAHLPDAVAAQVWRVDLDVSEEDALTNTVNTVAAAAPGTWLYYGYNAEYLFYPYCETRTVGELLAFHSEERRDAMLCYVVDLYAGDLGASPNAVDLNGALLDSAGYYALVRPGPDGPKERQLDFFGGLRWRFEEHVPEVKRKIDRISLFRAAPGTRLRADHTFSDEEYNTYACPWHHNLTAAVCSFRTAKALMTNPGSRDAIQSFSWHNSTPFAWSSAQLLDLGLMEPGQWF